MKNKDNKSDSLYQYTRSISFRAELTEHKTQDFLNRLKFSNEVSDSSNLSKRLLDFYNDLEKLIYKKDSKNSNKTYICKSLSINKTWLKIWHKDIFHLYIKKNRKNKYLLKDLISINLSNSKALTHSYKSENLNISFKNHLDNWKKTSESLQEMLKAEKEAKESQFRKSDISESLRDLLSNQGVFYFESFLQELHSSDSSLDFQIKKIKKALKEMREILESLRRKYQSLQAEGLEVAKASLNYYTVNKKPKEYYEGELLKAKRKLDGDYFQGNNLQSEFFSKIIQKNQNYIFEKTTDKTKIFQFESKQEKAWVERYCEKKLKKSLRENDIGLSLNQTYSLMKSFKAEQKNLFYELASRIPLEINNNSRNKNATSLFSGYQMKSSHTNPNKIEDYINNNKNHILYKYSFKNTSFNSIENLSCEFSLFKGDITNKRQFYQEFIKLSKEIKKDKNSNKSELAKKRGRYLQDSNEYKTKTHDSQNSEGKAYFKDYTKFCDHYKQIAKQRGKLIAQIKGIEKEKRESLQTNYWALIWTQSNKKQLWLIPKNSPQENNIKSENTNIQSAKKFVDDKASIKNDIDSYLSCFESLTMRALHKLCFAEESSFVRDMPSNLKNKQKGVKEFKTKNKNQDIEEQKKKEKEQKEIQFLKELLQSEYAHKNLHLGNFNLKEVYKAQNKKNFELAIEKACYYEKKISLSDKEKQDFLKGFNVTVLDISSYDLQERNKNTYQSQKSENRVHTDWWNEFWKQNNNHQNSSVIKGVKIGAIRLNPEIKIRYRQKDEKLKRFLEKRGFSIEDNKFINRKIQDQLTTHFTLSLNAGKKHEDLAFSKPEEILEKIKDFNKELNKDRNFDTAWKYGIDRGNIELATLCLAKFKPEDTYKVNGKNILKPTFPKPEKDIECYSLKDFKLSEKYNTKIQGEKTRFAVKNISYFLKEKYLNNTNYFKKEALTCIDLTTAKVINGKIITNGDIMTYLKLKKAVAKRRIFELYGKENISFSSKLEWSNYEDGKQEGKRPEGVLNIKTKEGEKTIYWYCKKYEGILINSEKNIKYTKENIRNSLSFYLENLKKSNNNNEHTPSIQKINHLRDALTANMVGVIYFLQKEYPGFIILEDLDKKIIDKHFFQHEENISRRLENALYNKFQTLGWVPPHVKDIIQLRENTNKNESKNNNKSKKLNQIGAIVFVPEKYTSKACPYCEKVTKQNNDLKFRQHRFLCDEDSCFFDTYYFNKNYKEEPIPKIDETKKKVEFEIIKNIDDPDKVASFNIAKISMEKKF